MTLYRSHLSTPGVSFTPTLGEHVQVASMLASDPIALCQLIRPRSAHLVLYFKHLVVNLHTGYPLRERCSLRSLVGGAKRALPRRPQPALVRSCCRTTLLLATVGTLAGTVTSMLAPNTLSLHSARHFKPSTDVPYFRDSMFSDPHRTLIPP